MTCKNTFFSGAFSATFSMGVSMMFGMMLLSSAFTPTSVQAQDQAAVPDAPPVAPAAPAAEASDSAKKPVTGFPYTNSKGKTYHLHTKMRELKDGKQYPIYFFTKDPINKKGTPLAAVPKGYIVSETKSGMLVLKKDPKTNPKK